MASEGEPNPFFSPRHLPTALLVLAVFLSLIALSVGWFRVDTTIQTWQYNPNAPDGKGNSSGIPRIQVDLEMRPFELNTQIKPRNIQDALTDSNAMPTYDEQAGRTGTSMLGVFLLHAVALLCLAAAVGTYFWHRRGRADRSVAVWKFAGLFGAFALLSVSYLAAAVPSSAEKDTSEILEKYVSFVPPPFPTLDPQMLSPSVGFWNTWTCCGKDGVVKYNGQSYLVVVTTKSRPSAGFWLEVSNLVLVTAGLVLAARAGHFDSRALAADPRDALPAPAPPKAA